MLFRTVTLLFVLMGWLSSSVMAAGDLRGRITDSKNGKYLIGANVVLKGSGVGNSSDRDGRYLLKNIPNGTYTVAYTYLGYQTQEMEVIIRDGETLVQNIAMEPIELEFGEVVVEGVREGRAKALNMQKTALSIKNVVASDQIGKFPDPNVAEALQRVPALSIQRDQGEGRYVLVRGTEARLNSVSINGDRIPSPEGDVRNVALDVIPAEAISTIEVSKALTPDMDADAIGGAINLTTKSAFDYNEPVIKLMVGGGYNELVSDGIYQGSATYANKFGPLGLMLSGQYYKTYRGSDNLEQEFTDEDFGNGDEYFIEEMQLRDYLVERDRLGLSATLDYQPSDYNRFFLRGMFNEFGDQEYRRRLTIGGDVSDPNALEEVDFEKELKDRYEVQQIWNVGAGGYHNFRLFEWDYQLSFSHSEESEPDAFYTNFKHADEGELTWDRSDVDNPKWSITNGVDLSDNDAFEFDELSTVDNLTTDENFTVGTNFTIPFTVNNYYGNIKVGGKLISKTKSRNNTEIYYDGFDGSDLTLAQFLGDYDPELTLDGNYDIGLFQDPDKVRDFFKANKANFEFDENSTREDSDLGDYFANEVVYAAYGMGTMDFQDLRVIAGMRFERTDYSYRGYTVDFDSDGDYVRTNKVSKWDEYDNFMPAVILRLKASDELILRAAWTNSLARPNYYDMVPYQLINREDEEIERGNPELTPTASMNLDFFAEYYLSSLGLISGGVFYKNLSEYIYYFQFEDENGFEVTQPRNGEEASLYGFEVAWEQQLTFLPGWLNGFGVYANYTYTDSEAKFPDGDETYTSTLPGQATHVTNLSVSYDKFGFSGRVAMNYHGKYVDEVRGNPEEDRYYDNHVHLDASASYEVLTGVRVFGEFLNLTNTPLRYYAGNTKRPEQQEFYSFTAHFGVKVDL